MYPEKFLIRRTYWLMYYGFLGDSEARLLLAAGSTLSEANLYIHEFLVCVWY
jgi:hypothetical protein